MALVELGHGSSQSAINLGGVSGIVGLLGDTSSDVKAAAVEALLGCVDENWHEIANGVVMIEDLAMDESFGHRKRAALLASKIMYHLDLLDEALSQALNAEELFGIQENTEYTHTILAEAVSSYCLERQALFDEVAKTSCNYTLKRVAHSSSKEAEALLKNIPALNINVKLEALVERMIKESWESGESGEMRALGIALETRRLDLLCSIIRKSSSASLLLQFCSNHCQRTIQSKRFRFLFQKSIVELYDALFPASDRTVLLREYTFIARALAATEDYSRLGDLLSSLIKVEARAENETEMLLAFQIAFDLVTFENQALLSTVLNHPCLDVQNTSNSPKASPFQLSNPGQTLSPPKETDYDATLVQPSLPSEVLEPLLSLNNIAEKTNPEANEVLQESSLTDVTEHQDTMCDNMLENIVRLKEILSGKILLGLTVDFLHRENRTNLTLLDQLKNSVDPRSSVTPNGIVICHAFMQCGTTCDVFIRENLEWFGRAVCWAKFTVSAANGVLHKGHITASKQVLAAYLPGSGGGPYSEGGSLLALGLIHANRFDASICQYLLEQLQDAQRHCSQNYEPLQHGACLGLGLLGMGSNDPKILTALKDILFADSAVAGEAAAVALGMVSVGSGSVEVAQELLNHAHDTEHERAVRGAALGIAFVMYRKEEEALPILEEMIEDKDPMVRYGAMFGLGLAFCGTFSHSALRRLLHFGISDVSSDVRRAAVIAIGFVACGCPNQVPRLVSLLSDSFNPHVRYAAALAIGIGCCGTASLAAVNLLLPLTQDTTDFVRQGALLGLGLVLVQASSTALPDDKVQTVRKLIIRIAGDKHEDTIVRFGAIVSQGLIDIGGRNGTISFHSSTNSFRAESTVGLVMFSQLWFWYPYILLGSLAFRATFLIGLNKDLVTPSDFRLASMAAPGAFSYIEPIKKEKKEEKRMAVTAILSTASRRRQQEQMRKLTLLSNTEGVSEDAKKENEAVIRLANDVQPSNEEEAPTTDLSFPSFLEISVSEAAQKKDEEVHPLSENEPLPLTVLENPCRIVTSEEPYILLGIPGTSWVPLDSERKNGVIMLRRVDSNTQLNASQDVQMVSDSEMCDKHDQLKKVE